VDDLNLKLNLLTQHRENLTRYELGRTPATTQELVQVRTQIHPQVFPDRDMTVYLLKGKGEAKMNDVTVRMQPGGLLLIPRDTMHSFKTLSSEPMVFLVVYSQTGGKRWTPERIKSAPTPKEVKSPSPS
jgi:mannose-6-phosphate isomerase-like protein (cupin superfamily)